MSETTPAETGDLGTVPNGEVTPEDVAALSVRYVDGQPVIVASDGTAVPSAVTVVDGTGTPVAMYVASGLPEARTSRRYQHPGVYIEELPGPQQIAGVGTSVVAFVGWREEPPQAG
ncbi:hypothetical protein ABT061_25190 [Streptosporangium sp. NPDC002544]|uniref:hypothetical protein n=1 Tax=Streptosporangium sp. NPDC002544 TaxID=3154538 RepID=UPI00332E0023